MNYIQQVNKAAKSIYMANEINNFNEFWYDNANYCIGQLDSVYQTFIIKEEDVLDYNELEKLGAIKNTADYDLYSTSLNEITDKNERDTDELLVSADQTYYVLPVCHFGTTWNYIGEADFTQECECIDCEM